MKKFVIKCWKDELHIEGDEYESTDKCIHVLRNGERIASFTCWEYIFTDGECVKVQIEDK